MHIRQYRQAVFLTVLLTADLVHSRGFFFDGVKLADAS